MDWMCEPQIIHGGNGFPSAGLSVDEHQQRTVANFLECASCGPPRTAGPAHSSRSYKAGPWATMFSELLGLLALGATQN